MKMIIFSLSVLLFLFPSVSFSQQENTGKIENCRSGFIDKSGKMVIESKFDVTFDFYEGLASVSIGGRKVSPDLEADLEACLNHSKPCNPTLLQRPVIKYGFIDKEGKLVIEPQFYDMSIFSEGLAGVLSCSYE